VNFDASRQTARDYMRLASNWQRAANLNELSIRKALEAISKDEKDDKKKTAIGLIGWLRILKRLNGLHATIFH
jgi:hypothetical protein